MTKNSSNGLIAGGVATIVISVVALSKTISSYGNEKQTFTFITVGLVAIGITLIVIGVAGSPSQTNTASKSNIYGSYLGSITKDRLVINKDNSIVFIQNNNYFSGKIKTISDDSWFLELEKTSLILNKKNDYLEVCDKEYKDLFSKIN